MKTLFKTALAAAALGVCSVAFAALPSTLHPNTLKLPPGDQAKLKACHAEVNKEVEKFKADIAKKKTDHKANPAVLKQFEAAEKAAVALESRMAKHETVAQCEAEKQEIALLDKAVLDGTTLGSCHKDVMADITKFRAEMVVARKEHDISPAMSKKFSTHEAALLKHEQQLGKHETVPACVNERAALEATNKGLATIIEMGRCHRGVNADLKKLTTDIATLVKTGKLKPADAALLKGHEADLLKHEAALKGHETVEQCKALDGELKAIDTKIKAVKPA